MFKVTITETKEVRKVLPKVWTQGASEDGSRYGYAPEIETLVIETKEIYMQQVESMDMLAVIAAVNSVPYDPTQTHGPSREEMVRDAMRHRTDA